MAATDPGHKSSTVPGLCKRLSGEFKGEHDEIVRNDGIQLIGLPMRPALTLFHHVDSQILQHTP
jgi:hypothetical protein